MSVRQLLGSRQISTILICSLFACCIFMQSISDHTIPRNDCCNELRYSIKGQKTRWRLTLWINDLVLHISHHKIEPAKSFRMSSLNSIPEITIPLQSPWKSGFVRALQGVCSLQLNRDSRTYIPNCANNERLHAALRSGVTIQMFAIRLVWSSAVVLRRMSRRRGNNASNMHSSAGPEQS